MVTGVVNRRREAIVPLRLRLRGAGGTETVVSVVIDTGFSSYLTMPPTDIAALGLPHHSTGEAELADGTSRQFQVHEAEVWWGSPWRRVLVSALGTEVLGGMRLLKGCELRVESVIGGAVTIAPLPQRDGGTASNLVWRFGFGFR